MSFRAVIPQRKLMLARHSTEIHGRPWKYYPPRQIAPYAPNKGSPPIHHHQFSARLRTYFTYNFLLAAPGGHFVCVLPTTYYTTIASQVQLNTTTLMHDAPLMTLSRQPKGRRPKISSCSVRVSFQYPALQRTPTNTRSATGNPAPALKGRGQSPLGYSTRLRMTSVIARRASICGYVPSPISTAPPSFILRTNQQKRGTCSCITRHRFCGE